MKRRPPEVHGEAGEMPERLRRFHPQDWIGDVGPLPDWCRDDPPDKRARYRLHAARRLWSDAGRAWCAAHGGSWYELVHPRVDR